MISVSYLLGFIGKLDRSYGGFDESTLNEQEKDILRRARREWDYYQPTHQQEVRQVSPSEVPAKASKRK